MNFDYSETQTMIAESARDFAEKYIRPHIMEWDEAQKFPSSIIQKNGRNGFYGRFSSRRTWRFRFRIS